MATTKYLNNYLKLLFLGFAFSGGILLGCASKPVGEVSSTANITEEISKLEAAQQEAREQNVDVLAYDSFNKSVKSLEEAKNDLGDGDKQESIVESLRYSKGYLNEATTTAAGRRGRAPGLFEARQNAMKAGVAQHPELKDEWKDLDKDVAGIVDELSTVNAGKVVKLQDRYVVLERKSVILTHLGAAQSQVKQAQRLNAASRSPATLRKAELSVKSAESMISSNVRNPENFKKSVDEANANANLLAEVTNTIQTHGKNLSEAAALSIVTQKRQITDLKKDLSTTQAEAEGAESQLGAKNAALQSAQTNLALQQAIEKSRAQFSSDEAEAYQQGNSLLIRLKSVNFASGKSDLPQKSLPLLSKVSEVAKSLNAKEIKVEGHTDAVGSENANQALSERRAEAVATYFKTTGLQDVYIESEGLGFQKPIANNKSQDGRAQNRRVDIIIVPQGQTATE